MKRKISIVLIVIFLSAVVVAQEKSREQRLDDLRILSGQVAQTKHKLVELREKSIRIADSLLSVDPQDEAEANKIGANAKRLYPGGMLAGLSLPFTEEKYDFSYYSFSENLDYYFAPAVRYRGNYLEFSKESRGFGYFANLGGTLIGSINSETKEFSLLLDYKLPEDFSDQKSEIESGGYAFKSKASVIVGTTYLVRVFNSEGNDGLVALKIFKKDSDGSIVIFTKRIFDISKPESNVLPENSSISLPDPFTKIAVENALKMKGFFDVVVDATTQEVTLRGAVPNGKTAAANRIALKIGKRKVNNQLTER